MNSVENDESEETKEQVDYQQRTNNQIYYGPLQKNIQEINQASQIQQSFNNEISFNGFKIYYNDPSEVINILEQKNESQEQQLNNQLENDASQNKIIEKTCKVCFEGEQVIEEKGELIYPCLCSGSCQYIHEQCLKTWIVSRGQNIFTAKCEICNYKYQSVCEKEKKMNLRYSFQNNKNGATITIIFIIFFVISLGVFILFVIDIAITLTSSDKAIINYDETLKIVALFIIFVFVSGFFIGMIQSFKENCLFEHVVKWQIFNYDKNQQKADNQLQQQQQQQLQDERDQTENNIQNQLNLISNYQPQQIQVSQQNNFDNSVYQRQETYSHYQNQINGNNSHQNPSHLENQNLQQIQQQPPQQNTESDQISQWVNYLRSKQVTPTAIKDDPYHEFIAGLNSAERFKMLEMFGYQKQNDINQNAITYVHKDKIHNQEFQPQQMIIKSKINQDQSESQIIQESGMMQQKKSIDLQNLNNKFNQNNSNQNIMELQDQNIMQNKSKSSHIISINKINNNINYRDINNKSQLSIQQDDIHSKAKTHFQFLQDGKYSQSIDYLRSQVIPPQFLTDQKKPNQFIDVILQCNE